jgi:hypothetical protein
MKKEKILKSENKKQVAGLNLNTATITLNINGINSANKDKEWQRYLKIT